MAQQPFSVLVAGENWRADAVQWLRDALAAEGIGVTGTVEQPRIRPWSTQLTVPTDRGRVWFKASCPSMSFEPALQRAMARLVPEAVHAPLAVDERRGWMLTLDHGPTVDDRRTPTQDDWQAGIAAAAHAQRALVCHRDELLALGLPDAGPERVVGLFDRLVTLQEPGLAQRLGSRRAELVEACEELAASPVPATWQHGDLHPRNLFGDGPDVRFFDLGDGSWAHAIEILAVPFGIVAKDEALDWDAIARTWTDAWQVEPADFDAMWRASRLTHAVNRAVTWHRALAGATSAEVEDWGDAVGFHLTRMLDT